MSKFISKLKALIYKNNIYLINKSKKKYIDEMLSFTTLNYYFF